MNTEELEQVALAKTYNDNMPDEFISSKEEERKGEDLFASIPHFLNHDFTLPKKGKPWTNDFSYLKIKDDSWTWHLLKMANSKYGMVLGSEYILDYSSCIENSDQEGVFQFRKGKEFTLEYRQATLDEFLEQMKDLEVVFPLVEKFETERKQVFYEYDGDAIYCYQEGYIWKLRGYSRNIISEYMQMYACLMSFTKLSNGRYVDYFVLKYIYLLEKHALEYLYKEIDLRKQSPTSLCEKYKDFLDVVTVSLDNQRYYETFDLDYYIAKRKKSYRKLQEIPLAVENKEDWYFQGSFPLGVLGEYTYGAIRLFSEIFQSVELKMFEKKELLMKIVEEKKQECFEHRESMQEQFLFDYLKTCFSNPIFSFQKDRWLDFLKVEKLPVQEMTSEALENWVQDWLHKLENVGDAFSSEEWKNFTHYIDWSAFEAKVEPLYLTITPTFLLVELEIFNQKKIYIISENYDLIPWNS